ncbi:hypothetical protein KORDIASMS9_04365 [Kordia sp. SMS9]|uniref:hypothetical protein n=1 Tax=Kordia sp. SMS9 TaxID=2282170 RepID=UPI000E10CC56|nr:hypothetical protein [Kordia sp. SMS9]AXG72102.1 hypothetical protein KORDIASMS9_04365 [Kordia sp. SMS9]
MKSTIYISLMLLLFASIQVDAQVGINTTDLDATAALKIESSNKGILLPRVALTGSTDTSTISNPSVSLLVYNTATVNDVFPGFYYWNGSSWQPIDTTVRTHSVAKYITTNSSTNINQSITAPVFGTEERNDLPSVFVQTGNQLQVKAAGRYTIILNIRTLTSVDNSHPIARISINGTPTGAVAGSAHVEVKDGHENSSLNLNETLNLNADDIITIEMSSIRSGNTTMVTGGLSNIIIVKLK